VKKPLRTAPSEKPRDHPSIFAAASNSRIEPVIDRCLLNSSHTMNAFFGTTVLVPFFSFFDACHVKYLCALETEEVQLLSAMFLPEEIRISDHSSQQVCLSNQSFSPFRFFFLQSV
jgi:hypothetical protein